MSNRGKTFKTVSDTTYDNDFNEPSVSNNNNDNVNLGYKLIGSIIAMLFTLYILNWLIKLDECKCSNIDEGKYLKEWFTFVIIYQIIWFFILIAFGINNFRTQYSAALVIII